MNKNKLPIQKKYLLPPMILGLFASFLCIVGCTAGLYSVSMNYNPHKASIPEYLKAGAKERASAISIAEFIDIRKIDDPLVIGHVEEKDGMKNLILPKYTKPTQAIASGIQRYLDKAGYKIFVDAGQWDLKEETMPKVNSKIIIGGNIEEMELTCRKGFPLDYYKARIKLNLVFANTAKGKILYRSSVESNTSLEHLSFSEARLEEQINIALGDAIERVFEDSKAAQKLKEGLIEK